MAEPAPTLAYVEGFLAEKRRELKFPAPLEALREVQTRARRARRLRASLPSLAIIYNLFLLADWFLLRDEFGLALTLHLLVVTPWILLTGLLIRDESSLAWREGVAASIPVAMVAQILTNFLLTSSPDASHYQYFVLLVLLYTITIQRLPFRLSVAVSCTIVAMHAGAVLTSSHMSWAAALVAITTFAVTAYFTHISNYYLERDSRRSYLHKLRDQLRHEEVELASLHDPLTDLANRRHLGSRMSQLWQAGDKVSPVAAVLLDIDHFKAYNDCYGHLGGDSCLKRIAAAIRAELRSDGDLAVRYGGEELLVLLPATELTDAVKFAERLRRAIEGLGIPHDGLGANRVVTASFGVASSHVSTVTEAELIAAADAALYAAKRNGRNQVWPPFHKHQSVVSISDRKSQSA